MKKDLIKKIRTELGMTQAEFAEHANIKFAQQVSSLENGRRKIGFGLLNRIVSHLSANGFQVSLDVTVTVNNQRIK